MLFQNIPYLSYYAMYLKVTPTLVPVYCWYGMVPVGMGYPISFRPLLSRR